MISRYTSSPRLSGGAQLGVSKSIAKVRAEIRAGRLQIVNVFLTSGFDRLDSLAGRIYGDARMWWILAAASNIGWGLQVPPGTLISVLNVSDVSRLM